MPKLDQDAADYDFRAVEEDDLPLLASWIVAPHWAQWWGPVEDEIKHIRNHIDSISVEPLIVELDGAPIAYLQVYDPHLEDDHPYMDQPFGTLGIDLSIGPAELLDTQHGRRILSLFVEDLFEEGAPRVIIDPHPENTRAIKAYQKAGFKSLDQRQTPYGPVLLMAIDNDEADE